MGKVIRTFCWYQNFVPKGLSVPALRLYTCIKSFKMCLKSYFKEIILNLKWKGLSVDINICPQGVVCPCPGAIYMYKSIKIYTRTRCQLSVYRTTGPLVYWIFMKLANNLSRLPLRGTGGHGFDPRPWHTKIIKYGTSCSSLSTQTYWVELGLVDPVSG